MVQPCSADAGRMTTKIICKWRSEGRRCRGSPKVSWYEVIYTAVKERQFQAGGDWMDRRLWLLGIGKSLTLQNHIGLYIKISLIFIYRSNFSGTKFCTLIL